MEEQDEEVEDEGGNKEFFCFMGLMIFLVILFWFFSSFLHLPYKTEKKNLKQQMLLSKYNNIQIFFLKKNLNSLIGKFFNLNFPKKIE